MGQSDGAQNLRQSAVTGVWDRVDDIKEQKEQYKNMQCKSSLDRNLFNICGKLI
jgi:hypothetical protein